jgi:GNAT superfamily N-acetyltransferase
MLDDPVSLRPVCPDDEPFLFDLYASTRRDDLGTAGLEAAMLASLLKMQFAGQQSTYRARFPDADHHLVLYDGHPVGRLYVDRSGPEIVLVDVTLHPTMRGRGLGRRLLRALLDEAAEAGKAVCLSVALGNPARRLYARLGFESRGHDGVYERMVWSLPEK